MVKTSVGAIFLSADDPSSLIRRFDVHRHFYGSTIEIFRLTDWERKRKVASIILIETFISIVSSSAIGDATSQSINRCRCVIIFLVLYCDFFVGGKG